MHLPKGAPREITGKLTAALDRTGVSREIPEARDRQMGRDPAQQQRCGLKWIGLFPDAVQRVAHKGVYARLRGLCEAVLRRSGIVPNAEPGTVPGLQRTTPQELRAALRPGQARRPVLDPLDTTDIVRDHSSKS